MSLVVRRASAADAAAISRVRVASWRAAYRGLIAQEVLDALDEAQESERRAAGWERLHADPRVASFVAERGDEVVGWAAVGPAVDDEAGRETAERGQVFAVYTLEDAWGAGVGHALMVAAEEHLRGAGFAEAVLWVLEGNERAARFYERHGWHEDGGTLVDDRLVGGTAAPALHERRRVKALG